VNDRPQLKQSAMAGAVALLVLDASFSAGYAVVDTDTVQIQASDESAPERQAQSVTSPNGVALIFQEIRGKQRESPLVKCLKRLS
jgi:hypothetical protein